MNPPLLIATRSEGKRRELLDLLKPLQRELMTLESAGIQESGAEDALEVYETFEENALAKGRYFARLTGLAVLADDSGLAVRALGGRPGVRSKRWSGRMDLRGEELDEANRQVLLSALLSVEDRTAAYVCAAVLVDGERELMGRGETTGVILHEPRGTGGFGYDCLFLSDDLGCTLAEASLAAKQRISHRGRAVKALLQSAKMPVNAG